MPSDSAIAAGISVSLVVILVMAIILFFYMRRRHVRVAPARPTHAAKQSIALDPSHPACVVTPFGSLGPETPRFLHEPGANMRVAHRREDGAWEFTDMSPNDLATFDLTGYVQPRNSLSVRSTLSLASTLVSHVEKKPKLVAGELTTRGFVEHDMDVEPPPAYVHAHRDSIVEP